MTTKFLPDLHGYQFVNRFEGNLPNIFLRIVIRRSVYGLCGGMVFSALDYFSKNCPIPTTAEKSEELEEGFIRYLWKRQQASMSIFNYYLLTKKSFQKNRNLIIDTITKELPQILRSIDNEKPVPLIIIRSRNFESPTNNHQILVTNYEVEGSETHLTCYDPNHPHISTVVKICRDINSLSIEYSTGEPMRGFFINHYQEKPIFLIDPK